MDDDKPGADTYTTGEGVGATTSVRGRKLGSVKDYQDTSGLAAAAEAARKKKAAASASPSPPPDPSTMSPLAKAAYEAQKKREAQAKGVEK